MLKPWPLALAIALASGLPLVAVHAESTVQQQVLTFDLPAASLGETLNAIARQSGQVISLDPQLVSGKRASAVRGSMTVQQAMQQALAGSGLHLIVTDGGNFSVLPSVQTSAALELSAVNISGKAPGATTEGTGLYTTYSSSSSTRLNLTPKETPQSLTVMTRQRLDDQRLTNLSDTLDATPGIIVQRDGLGAESDGYFSRGFEIQNFEIDGVPTLKGMDNYTQSMAMYDRVEVVRGATGLISGLGSPSATINLIRKRPTFEPQASLSVEAGNWDRYGTGFDVSGPLTETGNIRGRLVTDFKTEQAWIDRYKQDSQLIYGITEFDLSEDTLLTLGFSYLRTDVDSPMRSGLPTRFTDGSRTNLKRSLNSAQTWSYNDHEQTSFFASIEQQFENGWSGKIELTHSENKYDSIYNYINGDLDPDGSGTTQLPVRFSGTPRENNIDAYLTGPFDLLGREHELIAGVTLSKNEGSGYGYGGWRYDYSGSPAGAIDDLQNWRGDSAKPDFSVTGKSATTETQYAAYLATRLHATDDLSILLGSRLLDWHRDSEDKPYGGVASKTKEAETGVYVPYAGIVYALDDVWSLYASYTKIFNPQGSWVRDLNNARLDPMEGTSYEVGVKGSHFDDKLNSSFALFKIEQDNLAIWVDTPGGTTYELEQGTTTKGAEFTLDGELAEGWQASLGYAYALSTDADDKRIATSLPRHSLKTFTSYRLPGILDKITVGGGMNWQSKTGADLHSFSQGSYAVTNLLIRYDVNKNLSASLNLNNVFDREYFTFAGDHGMYGAPRNIMTGLKYTF